MFGVRRCCSNLDAPCFFPAILIAATGMNLVPFVARNAAEALEKIHAELGPDAVVVSVRKLPAQGLARLWTGSGGIEVLATVPETPAAKTDRAEASFAAEKRSAWTPPGVAEQASSLSDRHTHVRENRSPRAAPESTGRMPVLHAQPELERPARPTLRADCRWRSIALLESAGLLPLTTERLLDMLETRHGAAPPESLAVELAMAREVLASFWRPAPEIEIAAGPRPHVFVGPSGSGKTTVLCKWLTQAVLLEGRSARVWRLDGATANTAESLSVYGEILNVPVERFWNGMDDVGAADLLFIDFPGVEAKRGPALTEFRECLAALPAACVHLVLNAAYEGPTLLAQTRAFASLPVHDLIFTHLDEEPRWAKLWNLLLGTNFSVRFLSGGQNIPGTFLTATPDLLLPPELR
jgi:flagellar biosynthesis protein FlhF